MPRTLRLTLGIISLLLGIVGSFLPILQGWLFFLIGIFLLSRDIPLFGRIAKWLKKRFPRTTRAAERLIKKIHDRGIGNVIKRKLQRINPVRFRREAYLSKPKEVLGFIGWYVICFGVAWAASLAAPGEWYASLDKPFVPPGWIFGIVWTVLYALMALAAWLVWKKKGFLDAAIPMTLFFIQLALNGIWPWLFFQFRLPGWAFVDIVALWFILLLTLSSFWIENPPAGALLVPYFGWTSYAVLLNFIFWRLYE
jgi:benzodiazapine receptor